MMMTDDHHQKADDMDVDVIDTNDDVHIKRMTMREKCADSADTYS